MNGAQTSPSDYFGKPSVSLIAAFAAKSDSTASAFRGLAFCRSNTITAISVNLCHRNEHW
jgi:hypothetical protein